MRLLLISLASVSVAVILLLMARLWGLSQGYQAFDHPFLAAPKPWVAVGVVNIKEAEKVLAQKKDIIFWLELAKSKDGQFLVVDPKKPTPLTPDLLKKDFVGNKTYYYDLKTLRMVFDKEILVQDFLQHFPNSRFIFNLRDNAPDIHTAIIDLVTKAQAAPRVLFQSDVEIVLKAIKDAQPLWLFGTTRSDLMRLLTFDSIRILPACPYYADVFVAPMKVLGRPAYNENVLNEVHRRKKVVFLGPLENSADIHTAQSLNPDGIIYGHPKLLD